MTFELIVFLIFIGAPVSMVIHEFGHAIGALLVKSDQVHIHIGSGKVLLTFTVKNMYIHVHALPMIGGFTNYKRHKSFKRQELLLITILGPLNNLLFAFIFILLHLLIDNSLLMTLFLFNLWLAVMNIIPYQVRGKASDGLIGFRLFRQIYCHKNKHY